MSERRGLRKPEWKQVCPRDQLVTILAAVQGDLSNAAEGIGDPQKQIARDREWLAEAQQILRSMPEGSW